MNDETAAAIFSLLPPSALPVPFVLPNAPHIRVVDAAVFLAGLRLDAATWPRYAHRYRTKAVGLLAVLATVDLTDVVPTFTPPPVPATAERLELDGGRPPPPRAAKPKPAPKKRRAKTQPDVMPHTPPKPVADLFTGELRMPPKPKTAKRPPDVPVAQVPPKTVAPDDLPGLFDPQPDA